jgi:glucose/arabinose dehydrogenase
MGFGPDGKLYISTGDGADYDSTNSLALRSQDLDRLVGKILRVNPDATAPSDNPFYTTPSAIRSKVWQLGLRNPFKTTFRPTTGALYMEDAG